MSELGSELNQTFRILNRTDEDDFDPIFAQLVGHQARDDSASNLSPQSDSFELGAAFNSRKSSTSSGTVSEAFSPTEMISNVNVSNVADESCQVLSFPSSVEAMPKVKILNFELCNELSNHHGGCLCECVHKAERFSFSFFLERAT